MTTVMQLKKNRRFFFWLVVLASLLLGVERIFSQPVQEKPSDLTVNEFLAANGTGLTDEDGDYGDWIEIYNRGTQAINLSGWSLTDDPQQPEKWPFPNITLGSRAYLLVFASGKDRRAVEPGAELHTNFKLNRAGEFLALYNLLEHRWMDVISPQFPPQFRDIAYGRLEGTLAYHYLATPTPGGPNETTLAWADLAAPVHFSVQHGFYETPFKLELSTATPGATIRYTLDGSEPAETHGQVYAEPLAIGQTTLVRAATVAAGFRPAPVGTQSYIFLDDVLAQPAQPPGFPTTWGIHPLSFAGYRAGTPVEADYEMDAQVVHDPRYGRTLKAGLKAIPSMSIVTAGQNFYLYANPRERGPAWERPVSVELIYPDGREGFQINAGIRIQGGAGRWEFMPKHSFRLFFRDEYGAARLEVSSPLFPDSSLTTFDTLVLRGGSDRSYAGHPDMGDHRLTTYTHDEWLRASQIAMSGLGSHGAFVHLYLNGLYWGLYNVVERLDDSFLSSYLGGEKETWYVVNHSGSISGAGDRFKALLELAQQGGLAEPERYALVQTYLDTAQFCDYLILNWYAGNTDWPQNNWYAGVQNPAGRVQYFAWDGEVTWLAGAKIHLGQTNAAGLTNTVKPLFEALIQNPDFRVELADRMYKHLFHHGALTDANAQARWLKLNNAIEPAMIGESARWGDARYETPIMPDDWRKARDQVLAQMAGNAARLITLAREAGYYPELDPPTFNRHGGQIEAGFRLALNLSASTRQREGITLYYTTDGSDPRLPVSGAIAPGAVVYRGPLALTTTTTVKARAWTAQPAAATTSEAGSSWSALAEATFTVVEQASQLSLTEIMYNPLGGNDYEFIELKNSGVGPVYLAGLYFEDGITFTFPPSAPTLAPGESVVLARNPAAFAERYPEVRLGGIYQGKLSNQGEKLTLRDHLGHVIVSVAYDDENSWPISPDGRGDSLVMVDPQADPNNPHNWRASINLNGSPGMDEPRQ